MTGGHLRIQGRCLTVKNVLDLHRVPGHAQSPLRYELVFERQSENVRLMADIFFTTDHYISQTTGGRTLQCILIGALRGRGLGLVLRRCTDGPSLYERVGLIEFSKENNSRSRSKAAIGVERSCNMLIEALFGNAKEQVFNII